MFRNIHQVAKKFRTLVEYTEEKQKDKDEVSKYLDGFKLKRKEVKKVDKETKI